MSRFAVGCAFALALFTAGLPFLLRMSSTPIRLSALASQVSFVAAGRERLTATLVAKGITVAGCGDSGDGSIELTSLSGGRVSLEEIILALGDTVAIEARPGANYRLIVDGKAAKYVRVTVAGPVWIQATGSPRRQVSAPAIESVVCNATRSTIDVVALTNTSDIVTEPVDVTSFNFERTDTFKDGQSPVTRTLSAIISGTITLRDIGDAQIKLIRGDRLKVKANNATFRTILSSTGSLSVEADGDAHKIFTSTGTRDVERQPTYFDWIKANTGLSALWAAVLWVFGLTMSIGKWWKGQA